MADPVPWTAVLSTPLILNIHPPNLSPAASDTNGLALTGRGNIGGKMMCDRGSMPLNINPDFTAQLVT